MPLPGGQNNTQIKLETTHKCEQKIGGRGGERQEKAPARSRYVGFLGVAAASASDLSGAPPPEPLSSPF